jgi:hypothetical protein
MMRSIDMLILIRQLLGSKLKMIKSNKMELMKRNSASNILAYLDPETLFEAKFTTKIFMKIIKENAKMENATLKIQLQRLKAIWRGDKEDIVEFDSRSLFQQRLIQNFNLRLLRHHISYVYQLFIYYSKFKKKKLELSNGWMN